MQNRLSHGAGSRCRGHPNTQRLPDLPESPGRVWDKHPTAGRWRLLLLGAPELEGGVFLGGLGRAGLPGVALRWWRQRHLLSCLFWGSGAVLPGPAALEELTWALARPPYHARRPTPPPCCPCEGWRRVKGMGPARLGGGSSAAPPRGQVQKCPSLRFRSPAHRPGLRRRDTPLPDISGTASLSLVRFLKYQGCSCHGSPTGVPWQLLAIRLAG